MEGMQMGVLGVLGMCVAGGVIGGWIFQKFRLPQVVGYIVTGLLIGDTGFGLLHPTDVEALQPFTHFALGLIGFLVGGELSGDSFRQYGKQFTFILVGEGLMAFLLVGTSSTLIVYAVVDNMVTAFAAGIVFGAIASATDPASTIDVLWEYRSAGVLTTAIIAIVALDDALAMTLYGIGTSVASILTQQDGASVTATLLRTAAELLGALGLGLAAGFLLNAMMHYLPQTEKRMGMSVGILLLCIGLAVAFNLDVILATMAIGVVLINRAPRRSHKLFSAIRSFSSPIYIVFFVLVGARLSLGQMPGWIWLLVVSYVVMRSLGKYIGAYAGARMSNAEKPVQQYMGMALFAQGGVAVGLSIVASLHLQHIQVTDSMSLGDMIIFTVTATTLCVQLIGPAFARLAIQRAGEVGRNVTEEDVMSEWKVLDAASKDIVPLQEGTPLENVVRNFAEQDAFVYPVVRSDGTIAGVLTFDHLKELLTDRDTWQWLVVGDVMQPIQDCVLAGTDLDEALQDMQNLQAEALPVIDNLEDNRLLGVLDQRETRRLIAAEIVRRQTQQA